MITHPRALILTLRIAGRLDDALRSASPKPTPSWRPSSLVQPRHSRSSWCQEPARSNFFIAALEHKPARENGVKPLFPFGCILVEGKLPSQSAAASALSDLEKKTFKQHPALSAGRPARLASRITKHWRCLIHGQAYTRIITSYENCQSICVEISMFQCRNMSCGSEECVQ
ncbi:hypothetical protein E2C01_083427 [Portunus trituberculatus]|uniref:Uncharacterized protein n=1 Tax=Portunus trituberculatus TaxID=210409 RepID=A0A5B7ISF1_PORTR|nr:hypothetical protein [Portunus trituberculatus]